MSARALARLDMLHSYLCFLEGKGMIDFAAIRPFDFEDVVYGFAMAEPGPSPCLTLELSKEQRPLDVVRTTEEYDLLGRFSEEVDGDGYVSDEDPEVTHDDLVSEFLISWRSVPR